MPSAHVVVETEISRSSRARQLEGMFDVPAQEKHKLEWDVNLDIDDDDWNLGLIIGPSGCGKSTIARHFWPENLDSVLEWGEPSVLDDFNKEFSITDIAKVCQAVGFNTIPAWMRPYAVLSNGEKFRVDIARRLMENPDPIVVDEFTSVVDRQVAQIGCHAIQKYVRRNNRRFVGVSCHYDIVDWLQPDWVYEPARAKFARRSVRRRPALEITVEQCSYDWWSMFSAFHYLTSSLNPSARCYLLRVEGTPAGILAVLPFPHSSPSALNLKRVSRGVILPDFQGLGLVFIFLQTLGALYKTLGYRLRTYPAHPPLIRSYRYDQWKLIKKPGEFTSMKDTRTRSQGGTGAVDTGLAHFRTSRVLLGQRPCAVFEYTGEEWPSRIEAMRLTGCPQFKVKT